MFYGDAAPSISQQQRHFELIKPTSRFEVMTTNRRNYSMDKMKKISKKFQFFSAHTLSVLI
jgi:hypothetical protein